MADVKLGKTKEGLTPVGKGWVNKYKKEGVEKEAINITIDRGVEELILRAEDKLVAFPNSKREGKRDADYRLYISAAVKA